MGGGLFEGLTIVGAEPSFGKTTLAMQMADNMAKAGHDVLIFSLEMGSRELKARSLSRETLAACFNARTPITQAMTALDILQGKTGPEGLLEAAKRTYAGYNRNVYIHENMGKIGTQRIQEEVERHKRLIGKTPVIFIDYLQLLGPNETRYAIGTKEVMDAAVNDLRNMGIKHRTPVILISSFNRMNYGKDANFTSFKESGGIEYSADVLFTLQYDGTRKGNWTQEAFENAAKATPRKMELKVMKNRGGPWGMRIAFDYYAAANMFTER
jgi:replicative DNA helicase